MINGSLLEWIRNFLTGRSHEVIVEGEHSVATDVASGLPPETVLGPLLFLAFINDQADGLQSPVRLFADDDILYREIW